MAEMRAAYLQENVRALEVLGPENAQRVRAAAAAAIEPILAASRMAWLPMELDLAVLEAVLAVAGEDGVRRHAAGALLTATRTPLLRPILEGAVRLFGLKPEGIFKWSSQAWSAALKDCGSVTWERLGDGRGRIVYADAPPALAHSRLWLVATQGAFEGGLQLANAEGRVELTILPTGGGHFEIYWRP